MCQLVASAGRGEGSLCFLVWAMNDRSSWLKWTALPVIAAFLAGCASRGQVLNLLPQPFQVQRSEEPAAPTVAPREQPAPPATKSSTLPKPASDPWQPDPPLSRQWTCIVIHHTDSDIGSLRDINDWHHQKGWENGCGYHFVIGNGTRSGDGEIEVSSRWRRQLDGAHTRLEESFARRNGVYFQFYNQHGIGIALVGNFEKDRPTQRQLASLEKLVKYLMKAYDIPESRIYAHGDVDQTCCPGRYCNLADFRRSLRLSE